MLILFDIDATLITTSRAGVRALECAGQELHGDSFTVAGVEFAGRLDGLIIADLLARNGREAGPRGVQAMREAYRRHLERVLAECGPAARALPGVLEVVERLRGRATIGLLTGNFAETGKLKLRACGVEPEWFAVHAWGDESPHDPPARSHLPPVAMRRYETLTGAAIEAGRVTIVGDTPHDVSCARANGCRSLGVATGSYSASALRGAGADHVVDDMSDASGVASWLLAGTGGVH